MQALIDDMQAYGFPQAEIDKAVAQVSGGGLEPAAWPVHPDNVPAVKVFLAMATQWRAVGIGTMSTREIRRTGLDYGVMPNVARLVGVGRLTPDTFTRVRILEAEALACMAEEARRVR